MPRSLSSFSEVEDSDSRLRMEKMEEVGMRERGREAGWLAVCYWNWNVGRGRGGERRTGLGTRYFCLCCPFYSLSFAANSQGAREREDIFVARFMILSLLLCPGSFRSSSPALLLPLIFNAMSQSKELGEQAASLCSLSPCISLLAKLRGTRRDGSISLFHLEKEGSFSSATL